MVENALTVLIIGSVAWDEVIYLPKSLQAGTHNVGRRMGVRIGGGAANTAMALASMPSLQFDSHPPVEPIVISAVGRDAQGKRLMDSLRELGVDVARIHRQGDRTTRSLVLLDESGERTIINLMRSMLPLPPASRNYSRRLLLRAQRGLGIDFSTGGACPRRSGDCPYTADNRRFSSRPGAARFRIRYR